MVPEQLLGRDPDDQQLLVQLGTLCDDNRLEKVKNLFNADFSAFEEWIGILLEQLIIALIIMHHILRFHFSKQTPHDLGSYRYKQPEYSMLIKLAPRSFQQDYVLANVNYLWKIDNSGFLLN